MNKLNTPLDVYRLLAKTNCRECGSVSCFAFATEVIKQEKTLSDCPSLDKSIADQYEGTIARRVNLESIQQEQLRELQQAIGRTDLASREQVLKGRMRGSSLVISCLGRDFEVAPGRSCPVSVPYARMVLDPAARLYRERPRRGAGEQMASAA